MVLLTIITSGSQLIFLCHKICPIMKRKLSCIRGCEQSRPIITQIFVDRSGIGGGDALAWLNQRGQHRGRPDPFQLGHSIARALRNAESGFAFHIYYRPIFVIEEFRKAGTGLHCRKNNGEERQPPAIPKLSLPERTGFPKRLLANASRLRRILITFT
jgi:hypothetical protein